MSRAKLIRCPVPGHGQGHGDRNPSLMISRDCDGRRRVHCFAGCLSREALAALEGCPAETTRPPPADMSSSDQLAKAAWLWSKGRALPRMPAAAYLERRGLVAAPSVANALRYLPDAWHPQVQASLPALIASLSDSAGNVTAIQRLFLTADGRKADVDAVRRALGRMGRSAVRLAPAGVTLGLAEGVETALAASQLFGLPVWAACGARMHRIALPHLVRRVVIFADNDPPGLAASDKALQVFRRAGLLVESRAPDAPGADWADVLAVEPRRASDD